MYVRLESKTTILKGDRDGSIDPVNVARTPDLMGRSPSSVGWDRSDPN
ncbi:MAG: hypothetical protein SWY16_09590 [Cyanobacteriota bacterium]|nr:hypothetical protein [Cyanobacteriota bacterium]